MVEVFKMDKQKVIRELRGILADANLNQEQYDAICQAIRLLGGNP